MKKSLFFQKRFSIGESSIQRGRFTMSWRRKQVFQRMLPVLMLLFVVAAAADDVALTPAALNVQPALQLSASHGITDDPEPNSWKVPKYQSTCDYEVQSLYLVIRHYLKQFNGCHVPSSPGIFFQPDRAPPFSYNIA
jgi:hypothetical protein